MAKPNESCYKFEGQAGAMDRPSPEGLFFELFVRDEIVSWLQRNWSLLEDGGLNELDFLSRRIRLHADKQLSQHR